MLIRQRDELAKEVERLLAEIEELEIDKQSLIDEANEAFR